MEIKEFEPKSTAKMIAILFGVMGLLQVFFALVLNNLPKFGGDSLNSPGTLLGLLTAPIFSFIFGYAFGYIGAILYNKVAERFGGIILKVKK